MSYWKVTTITVIICIIIGQLLRSFYSPALYDYITFIGKEQSSGEPQEYFIGYAFSPPVLGKSNISRVTKDHIGKVYNNFNKILQYDIVKLNEISNLNVLKEDYRTILKNWIEKQTKKIKDLMNLNNIVKEINKTKPKEFHNLNWTIVRKVENIVVEKLDASDIGTSWPDYLRTTARIEGVSPEEVIKHFRWNNFHTTHSIIDPFHESAKIVYEVDPHQSHPTKENSVDKKIKIMRKTTKRPFLLAKREYMLAIQQMLQPSDLTFANPLYTSNSNHSAKITIHKGSYLQVLVAVKPLEELAGCTTFESSNYVQAYQDLVAWFVDDKKGGTIVLVIMRVDIGLDIPRWLFLTTAGTTGVTSMIELTKYLHSNNQTNNQTKANEPKTSIFKFW